MPEFPPNTYMLEYRDGTYLCNGTKRVAAPLDLETLEEAVRQCPKLQQVSLDDAPFGDGCFHILAQLPKLNTGVRFPSPAPKRSKRHDACSAFLQNVAGKRRTS